MATASTHVVRCLGFSYVRGRKVSRRHLLLLALSDWLLLLFLGRERRAPAPSLASKRIVVAKIDHLGDVMMITPLLRELRAQAPSCTIELMLGSWSGELAALLREAGLCDGFFFYDSPSLDKGARAPAGRIIRGIRSFRAAVRHLRAADVYIDLRPFTPNTILAARLAHVPHKIGFGTRGRAFFLQQELPYSPDRPLGELFLGALPALGLKGAAYTGPCLPRRAAPRREAGGFALPERFVVLHPFSRERSKMLPGDFWIEILSGLAAAMPVVVLGSAEDRTEALSTRLEKFDSVVSLVGRTTFREAVEVMAEAAAFVGVDSIFAHVAVAYDRPAVLLLAREGGALKAAFPANRPRLLFAEPGSAEARPEILAASILRLAAAP